jgi:VanZ family protein
LLDEISQPLFGRSCELRDWIADVVGGVAGLAATYLFMRLWAASAAALHTKR